MEAPINLEDLTRDIFQEVDDENIAAVRVSLGRYILRERDYEFDVPPMYKKIKNRNNVWFRAILPICSEDLSLVFVYLQSPFELSDF